jgi:hypothetical protein
MPPQDRLCQVADRFGLEITRRNRPATLAFVKLQHENPGNPRFYSAFLK